MFDKAFPREGINQYGMSVFDYYLIRIAEKIIETNPQAGNEQIAARSRLIVDELMKVRR